MRPHSCIGRSLRAVHGRFPRAERELADIVAESNINHPFLARLASDRRGKSGTADPIPGASHSRRGSVAELTVLLGDALPVPVRRGGLAVDGESERFVQDNDVIR